MTISKLTGQADTYTIGSPLCADNLHNSILNQMDYTKNELALIDLISNLNKEFYYFGEEGDLIPSPRWEIRETVDKFVSQFMQSIESERDLLIYSAFRHYRCLMTDEEEVLSEKILDQLFYPHFDKLKSVS